MKKRIANWLVFLVPALIMACGGEELQPPRPEKAVRVRVAEAEIQPLDIQAVYSGTVEPIEKVRLSTKIMGWVDEIYFKEGEAARKGEVLVKLRSKDLEAKRAQAEAAIAEATVHYKTMETNLKRIEALFAKKAATQKELDDMRAAFASAKARKIQAEKMKVEVDEILKYSNIAAPFDGVVGRKFVEAGDLANPGMPILEFENTDQVKIVAKVPESEVGSLQPGMNVRIQVRASHIGTNGKSTEGVIDRIVPAADPMSRQFDVHVIVDNRDGRMRSGMFARIMVGGSRGEGLFVPRTAVFRRGQLEGLYVVDSEQKAHLRWIRTGIENDGFIEVLSGLNPGEKVVVEGAQNLVDGASVEVVQ
ncbi:MAG: efflux RND transporter periplasmic adaptor subunit [Calditrichaeota bacterium]|nr:MAG: efflux RND transporter periplasmic adaptor subunit [Calditrichota bacterium]